MRLYAQYRGAYAGYTTSCGSLVTWSPPAELYTGFYPNQRELVTLRYRSATPQQLRISLSIPDLTQVQSIQVNAGPAFQSLPMKPPLLGGSALDALVGPRQRAGQLHLTIQSPTDTLCDTSIPLVLKSRQWMHWYDAVDGDESRYLAGWVTPQDPSIKTLIRLTGDRLHDHPRDYEGVLALAGYDAGRATPDTVRAQVNAIFDTLQFQYHMHYAEDNVPFDRDAEQLIQLPRDVLPRDTPTSPGPTAMCVETTAIMASAVENLGMRAYFVIVPGHAFLGVALGDSATAPISYWETSDLNGGIFGSQANIHGDSEFASYNAQHEILRTINVQDERTAGIGPIE
jgi:hypothetical protein